MLHYSLVYPHLNYVTEVWGTAGPTYLNRIPILQRVVNLIQGNRTIHSLHLTPVF